MDPVLLKERNRKRELMKLGFKDPNPNGYMPLVHAMAKRDQHVPVAGDFDPEDPISVRSAYEEAHSGPANGPTGGYFDLLLFLANVEGRLNYKPRALTGDEPFERIVENYWEARCRNGVVSAASAALAAAAAEAEAASLVESAPAPAC